MTTTDPISIVAEVFHRSWCYGHDECEVPFIDADLSSATAAVAALAGMGDVTDEQIAEAVAIRKGSASTGSHEQNVRALLARQAAATSGNAGPADAPVTPSVTAGR